jgi:tetratricopeptide (TPR) repeat protein
LEQALTLAKANDNKSQTIKTLLQFSSVAFDAGETSRSTEYAQEAVDLAQKNGMENLSAQALVDLGNSFLVRGAPTQAEKYLSQALESAARSKARRTEARARVSLGGLQNDPDEAVRYLEPALAFFEQGGYRSETFSCLASLARANLKKGDYDAARKGHDQLFQLAEQSNDQSLVALAHAERGSALVREEKFTEAIEHLDQARAIYSAQGVQRSIGYNLMARSDALWRLGRFDEARALLDQVSAIAEKPGGELKRLAVEAQLILSQIALSQVRFPEAKTRAEKVFETAGTEFKTAALGAKMVMGSVQSQSGATAAGKQAAVQALDMAKELKDPAQLAQAQLGLAEATLLAGDFVTAASNAKQAADTFARLGQQASEWHALLIEAQATQNLGDKNAARAYAMRARDTLSKLEQRWGNENFNSYLRRPDVQRLRKQLDQLPGSM